MSVSAKGTFTATGKKRVISTKPFALNRGAVRRAVGVLLLSVL